jgi:hypothetical protein
MDPEHCKKIAKNGVPTVEIYLPDLIVLLFQLSVAVVHCVLKNNRDI